MSKLALFAGHYYYPRGGADDFRAFGDEEYLKQLYASHADRWSKEEGCYPDPWGQIVDLETMKVILEIGRDETVWTPPEN